MLGFLKDTDGDIEGLTGSESNPIDPALSGQGSVAPVRVSRFSGTDGYVTDPDPAHEYPDVTLQIFGETPTPSPPIPRNDGFVLSYSRVPDSGGVPVGTQTGRTIMECFDPVPQLPVLTTLARAFVLCDHWFSSVPGPTWPNRFFVHAATSNGHTNSPAILSAIQDELGFSTYGMRTIYDSLSDQDLEWTIYYHDFPQALALTNLHSCLDRFQGFGSFLSDVAEGTLPAYSFIEPRYFNGIDGKANDQHPPHDVRDGERLIATVYEALRNNISLFEETLLVVLYDEHGGYFDHVPPPPSINPDGRISADDPPFCFDRLGIRIPALLISPLVPPGGIDHTVYDHTSIPATVKKIFGLPRFLTKRGASAHTFEAHVAGRTPRDSADMPVLSAYADGSDSLYATPLSFPSIRDGLLTPFQQSLIDLSHLLNLRSEADVSAHLAQQLDAFRGKRKQGGG
jgi:phospholipase C